MSKESYPANGVSAAPQPGQFRNPMISGFNPDPSIIRVDNDYFLATSTFEYYPGVPIYHSTDLTQWSLIGHCLTRPSQLDMRTCEASMGIFAPTLRHWRGKFYMTTMAVHAKGEVMQVSPKSRTKAETRMSCLGAFTCRPITSGTLRAGATLFTMTSWVSIKM
jgi:beta-xylosidase